MWVAGKVCPSNIESVLRNLQHSDRTTQPRFIKEICSILKEEGEEAISVLLEYVNAANGIEICSKLFSVLAITITNDARHYELVATCADVYDAASRLLGKGVAERARAALVLLAALQEPAGAGAGDARRARIAQYARGKVRLSGCLAAMSHLFFKDFMYAETWSALCLCLAASCRGCAPSQTSCSHLVPHCVEKISRSDGAACGELLQLLQALLDVNPHNKRLFLQARGILIFNRTVLVRSEGAWLLKTLLEGTPEAAQQAFSADLPRTLSQLIATHGAHSQVGEWCSVCLFHITQGLKEASASVEQTPGQEQDHISLNNLSEIFESEANIHLDGTVTNRRNSTHTEEFENTFCKNTENVARKIEHFLMKNVSTSSAVRSATPTFKMQSFHEQNLLIPTRSNPITIQHKTQFDHIKNKCNTSRYSQTPSHFTHVKNEWNKSSQTQGEKSCQTSFDEKLSAIKSIQVSFDASSITEFTPEATSTPTKHERLIAPVKQTRNKSHLFQEKTTKHSEERTMRESCLSAISTKNMVRRPAESQLDKNISIGSKLFRSFNASCSSIMQGFKNLIPGRKANTSVSVPANKNESNVQHRESSFAGYMQQRGYGKPPKVPKRDAGLDFTQISSFDSSKENTTNLNNACRTCNDTVMLQKKLKENECLKATVSKLKIGINTYGCNFKKIAKAFWPHDKYMTSAVLYNLYRKLIIKQSQKPE